ncbi:MAG: nucleotidyl transferase AbiEii/AbiGii toxin family protein [Caldisericaceae bacterium]
MKKEIKNKPASISARLMNIARNGGIDFDSILLRYFQERLLKRLSVSDFADSLILKGGLLLLCLKMPESRPTKDIDFLSELKNDINGIQNIFRKISAIKYDDGVEFIPSSIESERITEDADYEGIRLKIEGTLGKIRKRLQIDIGFGDVISSEAAFISFPSLIGDPLKLNAYPVEYIISEKFEAMIKLEMINSRMKDFYDVYYLSLSYDFDGDKLKQAIEATFQRRQTPMPENPLIFRTEFRSDKMRQKMWASFLRKLRLPDVNQEFSEVMLKITAFLEPIVSSINEKSEMNKSWNAKKGTWE